MKPILLVEFSAKAGDVEFKEESIPLHSPQELFDFVAPGGGCEAIPNDVGEIKMIFFSPNHANLKNPIADIGATLQLHRVFFTGPLAMINQTVDQIIDKAGRSELSESFLQVIGAG